VIEMIESVMYVALGFVPTYIGLSGAYKMAMSKKLVAAN
jgi:hypothetical protein